MTKKSQVAGQIFVYIISIVVVAVILLFGYVSITQFTERTNKVGIVDFSKKMEQAIITISSEYATTKTIEFMLNSDYDKVCFVNNYEDISGADLSQYPLIIDYIQDKTGKNIFLIKKGNELGETYKIGKIVPNNNLGSKVPILCVNVRGGRFSVRIDGKGDHAVISNAGA